MESKLFSYKVEGVVLEPVNDNLKISPIFDRKEVLEKVKEILKEDNFTLDERTIEYNIEAGQLYLQGLAIKHPESKSIGFRINN
ncbi:MAG: hypothetical protein JWR38_4278 [Mucilaginibacter sp.]|nr:hypothetical protein [Mucilaginibacter sp.]